MTEVGYFDTYSVNNNSGFNGSWSVYPYFASGHIVISDRAEGFVLVKESGILNNTEFASTDFIIVPNPAQDQITVTSVNTELTEIIITDVMGKIMYSEESDKVDSSTINLSGFSEGMYFVRINNNTTKKILKN